MGKSKDDLHFTPTLDNFFESRIGKPVTIFSGGNNSGKSLVLKYLKSLIGRSAYMIGPIRFYHIHQLSTAVIDPDEIENFESQFNSHFYHEEYNHEQNFLDLNRIMINLNDDKRNKLFKLCGDLIGNKFTIKKYDDKNDLSMRYIDMDGQNLSVASTGTRLLMTMLGICMDERFNTILIDEPELGLGPKVQQAFSGFLQNNKDRKKYFPHLNQVFIATHSHIFLDKSDIENNFIVSKKDINITLQNVKTMNAFHRLQFNQLGNTFESMFLPAAIIVAEGPTDFDFIDKLIQLKFPDRKIIVQHANGDGEVKRKIIDIKSTFGNLTKSPFGERLFVVLDSVHTKGLKDDLIRMGMKSESIIIWDKNGIEYVYPQKILQEIFSCSQEKLNEMTIISDIISVGTTQYRKSDLSKEVLSKITASVKLNKELESKLIQPLHDILD